MLHVGFLTYARSLTQILNPHAFGSELTLSWPKVLRLTAYVTSHGTSRDTQCIPQV